MTYRFPADFCWGTATSAYQIEGAIAEGGRAPSVWDTFSAQPNRVLGGDTGAIACDYYHRYREDVQLMAALGVKHYRFSLSWSRILPAGRGALNRAGMDFYQRLVDALLKAGITPHITLYHWDSPQALEAEYGSWRSRQMAQDFADYATAVVEQLGDRVTHWITLNEIPCFTHMSYGVGEHPPHAPGRVVSRARDIWQTSHHALLAHGLGTQAIRAATPQPCSVALVDNFAVPVPLSETEADIAAARRAFPTLWGNGGIVVPALTGRYSPVLLAQLGEEAPEILDGDLAQIHQPLDALGINVYSGVYVRATGESYQVLPFPQGYPKLDMPWLQLMPDALYWAVRHVSETLERPELPLLITENGCAAQDAVVRRESGEPEVIDSDRILYLRCALRAAHRAIAEGYPLQGYFAWSLLDNFEWAYGYARRFGLTYVDYATQQRLPKASYYWYRDCIRQGRVL